MKRKNLIFVVLGIAVLLLIFLFVATRSINEGFFNKQKNKQKKKGPPAPAAPKAPPPPQKIKTPKPPPKPKQTPPPTASPTDHHDESH